MITDGTSQQKLMRVEHHHLTYLLWELVWLLDACPAAGEVTAAEAESHVRSGDVLEWLEADERFRYRCPERGPDFSLLDVPPGRRLAVVECLQDIPLERLGVRRNGILLLIAAVVEVIQRWQRRNDPYIDVRDLTGWRPALVKPERVQ